MTKTKTSGAALCALLTLNICCAQNPQAITATSNGWKTSRVVATIYERSPGLIDIGFQFPRDPDAYRRGEVYDFIEDFNGFLLTPPISPERMTAFVGVHDRATADAKIKGMLPSFTALVTALNNPKALSEFWPVPKRGIDKCNEADSKVVRRHIDIRGTYYDLFVGACMHGVADVDRPNSRTKSEDGLQAEKHRSDLIWAARSRILNEKEMAELRNTGPSILAPLNVSYREEDIERAYNDLLLQQFRFREIGSGGKAPKCILEATELGFYSSVAK